MAKQTEGMCADCAHNVPPCEKMPKDGYGRRAWPEGYDLRTGTEIPCKRWKRLPDEAEEGMNP